MNQTPYNRKSERNEPYFRKLMKRPPPPDKKKKGYKKAIEPNYPKYIDFIHNINRAGIWSIIATPAVVRDYFKKGEEKLITLDIEDQQFKKEVDMLKDTLRSKFVKVDEVAQILQIGYTTKKNVFLYGRGGHAKSEILMEFLKYIDPEGEESFVQACGEGLTEEKLFGGMNLGKFQKTGEIEYLVENSFMNKKYVVFEELLDSRMNVLLSLKDILTSGIFRQGSQQFKIKTQFIVCLTNRTKQEVSEDNSIKALLERFPLEMKVEWDSYTAKDYSEMFSKVLHNNFTEVATICETINDTGDFVSPRTAIHMAQVYETTKALENLKYFGATTDIIAKIEKANKERKESEFLVAKEKDLTALLCNCEDMGALKDNIKAIRAFILEITRSYTDKNHTKFAELKNKATAHIDANKVKMLNLIENE